MWSLLAQHLPDNAQQLVTEHQDQLLESLRTVLTQPEANFWLWTSGMGYLEAGLVVGAGLVYLLYGWKIFKILVLVNSALLGAWLGYMLHLRVEVGWWTAPVGAAVLAILAWPLMRYAVCVMGGLAGALLGAFVARSIGISGPMVAAGAAIGLVALGLLAFIVLRVVVTGFTSLQGSVMTVAGVVAVVAKFQEMSTAIESALSQRPYLLPVMVVIPALIGFVYQMQRGDGQEKK